MIQARLSKVTDAMNSANVDVLFLSSPASMGYLAGFFEDGHERLMVLAVRSSGETALICPALSHSQAERCGIKQIQSWKDGEDPMRLVANLAKEWSLDRAVIGVDAEMRADILLGIQNVLPAAAYHSAEKCVAAAMSTKDDEELDALRRAGAVVDQVYRELLTELGPGMSEVAIEGIIRNKVLAKGAKPTFCIVGTGAGSAEPHHLNGDSLTAAGELLLLDFGCEVDHYQADITRVVGIGNCGEEARHVYRVVFEAHQAAKNAVSIGTPLAEVDRAARKVIEDAGFGEFFTHRTGHGIGIKGHEQPNVSADNATLLELGHCFSIEPGIYLPGKFGVRLENIYSCGANGAISKNEEFEEELLEL